MAEFKIREMEVSDIPEVLLVDRASFSAPWSKDIYMQEITHNKYAHYFVVTREEHVIGYIGLWVVAEDAQVTNIAIAPDYRGYKIGEKLFGFALQYVTQLQAERLSLEVRVSNDPAKNLYKKFGLVEAGVRKNYYPDNGEDAIVMWVKLK